MSNIPSEFKPGQVYGKVLPLCYQPSPWPYMLRERAARKVKQELLFPWTLSVCLCGAALWQLAAFPALPSLAPSPRLRAPERLLLLHWALCLAFNCDRLVMLVLLNVPQPFLELSCPMCRIDCQTGTQSLDMQHSLPSITNHTEASRHQGTRFCWVWTLQVITSLLPRYRFPDSCSSQSLLAPMWDDLQACLVTTKIISPSLKLIFKTFLDI